MSRGTVGVLIAALWIWPVPLRADEPPAPEFRPKLVPMPESQRLEVLERQLVLEREEATIWYFGWGITWSILTVGQFASYWTYAPSERPSYWVWSAGSLFGTVMGWVLRPEMVIQAPNLKRIRTDPTLTPSEKLRALEDLWVKAHDDEILNRAWWQQLICIGTNVIPFVVLGVGWKQWDWAYLALGVITSEMQIISFPQLLRRFGVEERIIRAVQ